MFDMIISSLHRNQFAILVLLGFSNINPYILVAMLLYIEFTDATVELLSNT